MRNFFSKLGFSKADEMEKSIQLKSIRFAWIYTLLFLIGWSLYESYKVYCFNEPFNSTPSFLLISQNLVLVFTQLYFQQQMVNDAEEENKNSFGKKVMVMVVVAAIIVVLGSFTLLFSR